MAETQAISERDALSIERISIETLRNDVSGALTEQMASIAYHAFREPPWCDDLEMPRLHLGLGVDLMRRGASAYIARHSASKRTVGYVLGYEVFERSPDARDLTLAQVAGSASLDHLFNAGSRVFYIDTVCVTQAFRNRHAAFRLLSGQIDESATAGFSRVISRTALAHRPMRALFAKLGFEELAVRDAVYPDRSFWLLKI